MQLASAITLFAAGTSEGAKKAWDTRGRGRKPRSKSTIDRSTLSKEFSVKINAAKINNAAASVKLVAAAIGGTVTPDHHPWDILVRGNKIVVEVKHFEPGRKNLKATIHSGEHERSKDPHGKSSKDRKKEWAELHGSKQMWLVVHDEHDPKHPAFYARRVGDRGHHLSDPKDKRPGWSYKTYTMKRLSSPKAFLKLI